MSTALTRRAAMVALTASAASAALLPVAADASPASRAAWTSAVAAYRRLDAEYSIANEAFSRVEGDYFTRKPERPVFVMDVEGDYGRFGTHTLPVHFSHDEIDDRSRAWAEPERIEGFRRTLAEYRSTDAALRRELRIDALDAAQLAAMRRQSDALATLIATPAPDMTALAEKLSIILAEYDDESGGVAAVLADVRRLGGEAGA